MIARRLVSLGVVLAVVIAGGFLSPIGDEPEFELTSHLGDCENDGVDVGFTTEYSTAAPAGYRVTAANIRNIASECNGGEIGVILRSGATDLASGEAPISGSTVAIPVAPSPLAEDVDQVYVELARAPHGGGGPGPTPGDNVPPEAEVEVSGDVFSPNGDGRMDTFAIDATFTEPVDWKIEIVPTDPAAATVLQAGPGPGSFTVTGSGDEADVTWDGLFGDAQAPEQSYTWILTGTDAAGNAMDEITGEVTVDRTAPVLLQLSASRKRLDQTHRKVRIRFFVNEEASTIVKIKRRGKLVKKLRTKDLVPGAKAKYTWGGKNKNGNLVRSGRRYVVVVRAVDRAANRTINKALRMKVIR